MKKINNKKVGEIYEYLDTKIEEELKTTDMAILIHYHNGELCFFANGEKAKQKDVLIMYLISRVIMKNLDEMGFETLDEKTTVLAMLEAFAGKEYIIKDMDNNE